MIVAMFHFSGGRKFLARPHAHLALPWTSADFQVDRIVAVNPPLPRLACIQQRRFLGNADIYAFGARIAEPEFNAGTALLGSMRDSLAALDSAQYAALREDVRSQLSSTSDGGVAYAARATAVRGRKLG